MVIFPTNFTIPCHHGRLENPPFIDPFRNDVPIKASIHGGIFQEEDEDFGEETGDAHGDAHVYIIKCNWLYIIGVCVYIYIIRIITVTYLYVYVSNLCNLCICIHMFIMTCVYMYIYIYTYIYACFFVYVDCILICMPLAILIHMVYIDTHAHAHTHIHIYIYMHTHIYIYIYTYIRRHAFSFYITCTSNLLHLFGMTRPSGDQLALGCHCHSSPRGCTCNCQHVTWCSSRWLVGECVHINRVGSWIQMTFSVSWIWWRGVVWEVFLLIPQPGIAVLGNISNYRLEMCLRRDAWNMETRDL